MEGIINNIPFFLLSRFKKIYCLVSGGFDSTFLYEKLKELYGDRVIPVNCYNPYEWNETLKQISNFDQTFIKILPGYYKDAIKKAFLNLPQAIQLYKEKRYTKKVFGCCYILKHKTIQKDKRFKEPGTVIVSGIKRGDGKHRRIWLSILNNRDTYFHKHKTGMLYFYPFRNYNKHELPDEIINELYKKYPKLEHSGCSLCPILVLFNLVGEGDRYERSVQYAENLGVSDCNIKKLKEDILKMYENDHL